MLYGHNHGLALVTLPQQDLSRPATPYQEDVSPDLQSATKNGTGHQMLYESGAPNVAERLVEFQSPSKVWKPLPKSGF